MDPIFKKSQPSFLKPFCFCFIYIFVRGVIPTHVGITSMLNFFFTFSISYEDRVGDINLIWVYQRDYDAVNEKYSFFDANLHLYKRDCLSVRLPVFKPTRRLRLFKKCVKRCLWRIDLPGWAFLTIFGQKNHFKGALFVFDRQTDKHTLL